MVFKVQSVFCRVNGCCRNGNRAYLHGLYISFQVRIEMSFATCFVQAEQYTEVQKRLRMHAFVSNARDFIEASFSEHTGASWRDELRTNAGGCVCRYQYTMALSLAVQLGWCLRGTSQSAWAWGAAPMVTRGRDRYKRSHNFDEIWILDPGMT